METLYRCQNCDWTGDEGQLGELIDVFERVQPGDTMPDGECPECGGVCFADETPEEAAAERVRRAAPELLECLEWFANPPYPGAVPGEALLQQARAAIARARGVSAEDDQERARRA